MLSPTNFINSSFFPFLGFLISLRPSDFIPEKPAVAEYTTKRTMGQDCDNLAAHYQISREDQDQFAIQSYQKASKATARGLLENEIVTVAVSQRKTDDVIINEDEEFKNVRIDKIPNLKPLKTFYWD